MATDGSSGSKPSSSTADSYIGSLISLTSKSEIRYEGVLYNINTEESSIGLINVRSFGTEGRKKDGPQVPPSDKVYEYILFRGSDIKDLQVKSSPPVQPTPPINNDPAIIQSHYPRPSTSLPSAVSGPLTDPSSHNAQLGLPGSNFQSGLPLYQPGGNVGSWGASPPPPTANGAGLAMPMYWQGYYGPPNGLPHLHQQSLLRPPPGLSMPPSMQQSMQYPNFNAPLPTGASNFPGASNMPGSNMPEASYPLLPVSTSSLNLIPTSLPPSTLPSALPPVPSATLSSETLPSSMPNKGRSSTLPASTFNASLPSLPPLTTSGLEINAIVQPTSDKPNAISVPVFPYQSSSQSMPSIVGSSTSILMETPAPSLVTPGQLLQSRPTAVPPSQTTSSSQSAQTAHKDVQVVQVSSSSEPAVPVVTEAQPPILPLPVPPRGVQKPNGAPFQSRHGYRGRERGRGTGSSRPVTKFTEDFDFMAMNEKFKKDEVWGHLGKGNKSHSKDNKEGDGKISDEDDFEDEQDAGAHKAVYNKDDFFDSISSNARDYESQNGRTRFSEQMKIDTETFGDFSRYRGGRGGRGPGRGGRSRGSYYGRGYGYMGRGRGRAMPNRAS
ncbi:protein decapping 5 [Pistacia vera]|uniref:protein decapping 5-like n=1 Tax=Pistacia vera TaxID=55513 RepID=UPI00126356E6|nr:protein decapping 5-like [Pistacia vera]XP_031287262.1 protein decapping 5 [Pistacia vera]